MHQELICPSKKNKDGLFITGDLKLLFATFQQLHQMDYGLLFVFY